MRENRAKIQFFIDSTQNQAKTQDTHQKPSPLEQEKSETHQSKEGKNEKQSKTSSTHQSENGGEDEISETTHDEIFEEEVFTRKNRMEERELEEKNGGPRERLKRHRTEVAGNVWIPELWGQEELLMDWIDCSAFDACLVPQGIISARASLIEEGRIANSAGITVQNSC